MTNDLAEKFRILARSAESVAKRATGPVQDMERGKALAFAFAAQLVEEQKEKR